MAGLFSRESNAESPEAFWRRTAEKRGAEIRSYSLAVYLGRSNESIREMVGVVYLAGDTLWFEDFEKDTLLFGILSRKSTYVKTEIGIPAAAVSSARTVSRRTALLCIQGRMDPDKAPGMSTRTWLPARSAVQITLSDRHSLYFEIAKEREILDLLNAGKAPG